MVAILTRNLTKNYRSGERTIEALQDINLQIDNGELVAIIGPNGAGKTTLINILCGLLFPTKGEVIVDGKDVKKVGHRIIHSSISPILSLGLPSRWPRLKVREFLEFRAAYYGVSNPKKRAKEVIEWIGLTEKEDEWPAKLSQGMRSKLIVASAFLHDVPIYLLDEPTVHLDPVFSRDLRVFLRNQAERGKTILVSSQIMVDAEACDRVIFLRGGKIVAIRPPEQLRSFFAEEHVYQIHLEADTNSLSIVTKVDGVTRVETRRKRGKIHLLDVFVESEFEFENLVQAIHCCQGRILHLSERKPSLEDVFIRLAEEGNL